MSARVDALDEFSEDRDALSSIFADAQQLAFDGEGRIILPQALCEHAGITENAAFVGLGRTFQIWEPQRFEQPPRRAARARPPPGHDAADAPCRPHRAGARPR